jgi:hypothetical protein
MTYTSPDAEDALERATLALFEELGWHTVNAYQEVYSNRPDPLPGICLSPTMSGVVLPRLISGHLDVSELDIHSGGMDV